MEEELDEEELDEAGDEEKEVDGVDVCGYFMEGELVEVADRHGC